MKTARLEPSGNTKNNSRVQARTPRACDRCRHKKAKCDGGKQCGTCQTSNSACTYTARRGRELKSYYKKMREATDEALQRLYWACRKKSDFPGNIPDESNGFVTTAAVLEGLGVNVPNFDDMGAPQEIRRPVHSFENDTQIQMQPPLQANTSPVQAIAARQGHLTIETLADTLPIEYEQEYNSSTVTSFELATPIQMDIHEPFTMVVQPPVSAQHQATEALFSMEDILDMGSCTAPVWPTTLHEFCETLQPDIQSKVVTNCLSHFRKDQSMPGTMRDGFLSPWPGSLASALLSVSTM